MTFNRKPPPRVRSYPTAIPEHLRRGTVARIDAADQVLTIPKENVVRSEPYRRLVATLPCIHCGVHGRSQAAHGDMGKGDHIKSDDRTCYPACGPTLGSIGCHALIGATGHIPRDDRRALEQEYARRTRRTICMLGLWPANLPEWTEA